MSSPSCTLPSISTGLTAALDVVQWSRRTFLPEKETDRSPSDNLAAQRYTNLEDALKAALYHTGNETAEVIDHVIAAHSRLSDEEKSSGEPIESLCRQRDAFVTARVILSMVGYLDLR